MSDKAILNVQEAIDYLGISRPTIDRMRRSGQIKSSKLRGKVFFRREWLDQAIDRHSR